MKKEQESIPEPIALRHYGGNFMIRVPPQAHKEMFIEAAESGVSLNRLASLKLNK